MFTEPETWVAIAFVILLGLFAYLGVHRTVLTALDHRAERIKAELDEARRLKEDAAKVLARVQGSAVVNIGDGTPKATEMAGQALRIFADATVPAEIGQRPG